MKFDDLGLPQENGASDLQDSSRLAGIMATFTPNWPQFINLNQYVVYDQERKAPIYVRHPKEIKYDFSRDQAICLMAGLHSNGSSIFVHEAYITGKDVLSPSVKGHIARCQGFNGTWLQNFWLWLDVLWYCFAKTDTEPNQLLCMLAKAPIKYLRFFVRHSDWQKNLREYWGGWRDEPELAERIIKNVLHRVANDDARRETLTRS